jgi:hypothetical protein
MAKLFGIDVPLDEKATAALALGLTGVALGFFVYRPGMLGPVVSAGKR